MNYASIKLFQRKYCKLHLTEEMAAGRRGGPHASPRLGKPGAGPREAQRVGDRPAGPALKRDRTLDADCTPPTGWSRGKLRVDVMTEARSEEESTNPGGRRSSRSVRERQRNHSGPFAVRFQLTLYSSSQTWASRRELCVMVSWPSGEPYGRLFRKMCPTLEQGMMKSLPPHIQIWAEAKHMLMAASQCHEISVRMFMKSTFTK